MKPDWQYSPRADYIGWHRRTDPGVLPFEVFKLLAKIDVGPPHECWPWIDDATVVLCARGRRMRPLSAIVSLHKGCRPQPMVSRARRSCGNDRCCNPYHVLFDGVPLVAPPDSAPVTHRERWRKAPSMSTLRSGTRDIDERWYDLLFRIGTLATTGSPPPNVEHVMAALDIPDYMR